MPEERQTSAKTDSRRLGSDMGDWASRPWAMHRARLNAMRGRIEELLSAEPQPNSLNDEDQAPKVAEEPLYTVSDGVAIIDIVGDIWKEVPWIYGVSACAATSTLKVRTALDFAMEDPAVGAILFRIDSPGGIIDGVQELGDAIYAARVAGVKPVHAFIEDLGASAGYWLASQAERLSANKTAQVGSIGVYCVYLDDSEQASKDGLRYIVLRSGPFKGTGAGEKITPEELVPRQENINELAAMFSADVARGRAISIEAAVALTTGRTWTAPRALDLKMIDEVENFDAALAAASGTQIKASLSLAGSSTSLQEESTMGKEEDTAAESTVITPEDYATSHPEAVAAWREEGKATGKEEGKAEALEGVKALSEALPGRPEAALKAAIEGQSPTEAKAALADELAAENVELRKKAAALEAAGGAESVSGSEAPVAGDDGPGFIAKAKALRDEKKITLNEAMSEIASSDPDSFKAYKAGLRK